jgi:membrane dipeptidase
MFGSGTRREFLSAAGLACAMARQGEAATSKGPNDFIIVEGHRDIWELSGRTRIKEDAQRWPLTNFIVPRLIESGVSVVIMPAGGDSLEERDDVEELFEGAMRVLDMILADVEKSAGKSSIIRTKADVPAKPNAGKVQFFLDIEGGGAIQSASPEPAFPADRSMALLRQFYRLGVRGLQ